MKKITYAGILVASVVAAGSVVAEEAAVDPRLENTVEVTHEDGSVDKFYMNADGTYNMALADGSQQAGTWEAIDGQTCITQTEPEAADVYCSVDNPEMAIGASWESENTDGSTVSVSIVEGR